MDKTIALLGFLVAATSLEATGDAVVPRNQSELVLLPRLHLRRCLTFNETVNAPDNHAQLGVAAEVQTRPDKPTNVGLLRWPLADKSVISALLTGFQLWHNL